MKTIVSTLLIVFAFTFAFGQNTAFVKAPSDLTSIKETGKGHITLPERLTKEEVQSKAKYYTLYFTVDFDEKSKVATINMVENNERSRAIIVRFLAGCEVQNVTVGNETINRDLVFEKYLK